MHVHAMPGHLIRRLHQHSTQVFAARTREAGYDLTSVQFAALDAIKAHPGIDQASLAGLIASDRPTIGDVINRLEAKGLLTRAVNDADRRARVLTLTTQGATVHAAMMPMVNDIQSEILARLDTSQRNDLLALIKAALDLN